MSELTLRQLEYFVAVVDAGSVTEAARRVSVSQATVSMAIAALESSLGADLLIRHRAKGVVPTRAGRELSARARRVLDLTDELSAAVAAGASEMRGPIELGCVSSLSPQVVPPLAAHFDSVFPEVDFRYREGDAERLQSELLEGRLDIAVIFSRQRLETVVSHELAEVTLTVMLPSSHPLRGRREISFSQIAEEPAILIDLPPSRDRSVEFMRAAGVEPRIRWTSSNLATVTALVAAGLGYSLRYSLPGETPPVGTGVVEIPVADPIPRNAITAVVASGTGLSARTREVIDVLRDRFAGDGQSGRTGGTGGSGRPGGSGVGS